MDESIYWTVMLDVCIMNYLEACQRLLVLSSSSEQFHISKEREEKFFNTCSTCCPNNSVITNVAAVCAKRRFM